ncbi:thioesterase II family protein, partial [Streptomyces sp.]|uniref:thioesterase II family protein n=1 Tax=Streptomyces sp. TaxID=1931 RepID=UPI002F41433D
AATAGPGVGERTREGGPMTDPWTPYTGAARGTGAPHAGTGGRVRVYCFPHAGGTAQAYLPWRRAAAHAGLEIVPVELPGHGTRYHEPLLTRVHEVVDGVLGSFPSTGPFVLFGHSMGARIAYETALRLLADGLPPPLALVVSGSRPGRPGGPVGGTDESLLTWLRSLGGTAAPALGHRAVARAVVRTLRADLGMLAEHGARVRPPLPYPILALAGAQDEVAPPHAVARWRTLTSADFRYHVLPGGHFFPHEQPERVVAAISGVLQPSGGAGRGHTGRPR